MPTCLGRGRVQGRGEQERPGKEERRKEGGEWMGRRMEGKLTFQVIMLARVTQ